MQKRDNFSRSHRETLLRFNADDVRRRWPGEFGPEGRYYMCENCGFVCNEARMFDIDHVVPCARGGKAKTRLTEDHLRDILAGDVGRLYEVGVNSMVLCRGCNRSKLAGQFVPVGSGYARTRHHEDKNPDHRYSGPPMRDS